MNLPTSPTDAVAKAHRAITSALLGSEQEPIKEEVDENFEDGDNRPAAPSRPTVQLSVEVPGNNSAGIGGLGAESSLGSSDESSDDLRAHRRRR